MKNTVVRVGAFGVLVAIILSTAAFSVRAGDSTQGVQKKEQIDQSNNQQRLLERQPAPQLDYSVERQNLIDRMKRMNDANLVGYIYLLSDTGEVVASYVTKGKATSMKAYLTSYDMLVYGNGSLCASGSSGNCYNVESPDYDGAYGDDPDGIFFFTDTGAMVEWTGKYVWTDQPLTIKTPVSLVREVK